MRRPLVNTLSDGTTVAVHVRHDITTSTHYFEVREHPVPTRHLMRLGTRLYLVTDDLLVRLEAPQYDHVPDDVTGAELALAFLTESAESALRHARQYDIPVTACYGLVGAR